MGSHVVVEGENAFWEVVCICRARVTESLFYDSAECEECGAHVDAVLAKGNA